MSTTRSHLDELPTYAELYGERDRRRRDLSDRAHVMLEELAHAQSMDAEARTQLAALVRDLLAEALR